MTGQSSFTTEEVVQNFLADADLDLSDLTDSDSGSREQCEKVEDIVIGNIIHAADADETSF